MEGGLVRSATVSVTAHEVASSIRGCEHSEIIRIQNHSAKVTTSRSTGGAVWEPIAAANAAAALDSGGFAAAAVVDPGLLLPEGNEVTQAAKFYAKMFAARSLLLSATVVALILLRSTNWLGAFLLVADLVQAADALIGASYRNRGQTLAPAAAAAVHFASARWLLRGRTRPWRD